MNARPLFALVAGEVSGDNLGAALMEALSERYPGARFVGIAGPRMRERGMESLFPIERLSLMGITEVLPRIPELFRLRRRLVRFLLVEQPDVVITIDAPDFNLPVARRLRRGGLRTVHYVSPTVWAWRQGRVRGIRAAVDLILPLFPFEAGFYERHGVPVECVGHPMADRIPLEVDVAAAREQLGLSGDAPVLAVLPGSRKGEVAQVLDDFLEAARLLRRSHPDLRILVAAVDEHRAAQITARLDDSGPESVEVITARSHEVMAAADLVLLSSGTAALEAMLLKKPMVVGYRVGPVTWAIASRMVRVPWVSMPNLLAGEEVVPEFLQNDLTPDAVAGALGHWLDHPDTVAVLRERFMAAHKDLRRDASRSAATAIARLLEESEIQQS